MMLAAVAGLVVQTAAAPLQVAPFTDSLYGPAASRLAMSGQARRAPGSCGTGVSGTARLDGLALNPVEGSIGVWVKPAWRGDDGKRHRLWATEEAGGRRLVVEKSERGLLRAELTTPAGLTVARADVSGWKPGEWHFVVVGWVSNKGANVGLPLWVDKVAVDGPVTPHGVFDPKAMPPALILGDGTTGAAFDELVVRPNLKAEGAYGMVACVYRDYFRGAPYDAIQIDLEPTRVPSERRAVAGMQKQLGVLARRGGQWEPIVENVVRYSQWAYFDAKPLITWSSSDPSVATVDANGRVSGLKPGSCAITARFRGRQASYPLTVISADKPDADAICIELLPRYRSDAVKDRPAPGETVTARVRIGNFGPETLRAGTHARLSLVPHTPRDYRFHASTRPSRTMEAVLEKALAPGEEAAVEFRFPFPAASTWMKVDLDPANAVDELCEANNSVCELTDARPVHMGYRPKDLRAFLEQKRVNHIGSLSLYDWIRGEKLRMDVMLREAVYPTTGPNGVEEAYRIDAFTPLQGGNWDDEPYNKEGVWFDGGFPVNEDIDPMAVDCAIIHEFGHVILSQPDLYGYPVTAQNVFLTDGAGKPAAGSPELPIVRGDSTLPASPGVNVPCYVGYPSLMDGCQLWLHPSQAGHVMHYRGYRPDRFWGTQGRLIPTRANWLMVTDAQDQPLKGAAVYVYHVAQAPVQDSGAKYFADRPKFMGNTDDEGRFTFPNDTDEDWDDPETDEADGAKPVWNPFGTPATDTAFTPNVWEVEGLLLLKVVSGDQVEYRFMDLTQFNTAYLSGDTVCGKHTLRTSLLPSPTPTPLVRKTVPEAVRKVNKAPVAVAPSELTVKCGQEFEIDASKSYDPEGQPLIFRWNLSGEWLREDLGHAAVLKLTAPKEPKEIAYRLWVLDGVRCSQAVDIKVKVVR